MLHDCTLLFFYYYFFERESSVGHQHSALRMVTLSCVAAPHGAIAEKLQFPTLVVMWQTRSRTRSIVRSV